MSTDAMRAALDDAARSLETIATRGGKDEFLSDLRDVAAYAGNRARVARAALAQPVSAERVPLTDEQIFALLSEHTTYDLQAGEDPPLVEDNYGSRRYASRFIAFVRAIEHAHGITGETK
jgi:hypothetical protein